MKPKRGAEAGLITVEAVLSLVPFIIVILGITSFINIFMLHNKIQYALYEMGSELSAYTYPYQALGLRSADLGLKSDIDTQTEPVDKAIQDVTDFMGQLETFQNNAAGIQTDPYNGVQKTIESGQQVYDQGKKVASDGRELLSDPMKLVRGMIFLGVESAENSGKTFLLELISEGFSSVYLDANFDENRPMTADEYLRSCGVENGLAGLDFSESEFLSSGDYRIIDFVVEYRVEIYLFKLFLKDPCITVVQRCTVPAWLDGDGVHYSVSEGD